MKEKYIKALEFLKRPGYSYTNFQSKYLDHCNIFNLKLFFTEDPRNEHIYTDFNVESIWKKYNRFCLEIFPNIMEKTYDIETKRNQMFSSVYEKMGIRLSDLSIESINLILNIFYDKEDKQLYFDF